MSFLTNLIVGGVIASGVGMVAVGWIPPLCRRCRRTPPPPVDEQTVDEPLPNPIEDMPGHPETVRLLPDPVQQGTFGDIAEQLLNDNELAAVIEELGWVR